MYDNEKTICAIATGLVQSGIGIIRVSGKDAINIVSNIFVTKNKNKIDISESHKVKYGYIYDKTIDSFIDEVLVITMLSPKSYTAEDVVEVQCHGSILSLKKIEDLILKNGAVLAEPGEFTKRAFLNGRIDLSKAEAVSDFIMSKNEYAMKASFNQLKGNLSDKLLSFRSDILEKTAFIEACLDDPEHMDIEGFKPKLKTKLIDIIKELDIIIKNYDNGKIIKEGINTVILGKPNVGKSSLLNALLNENRAIVTDIAGTTRDTIKETINLNGISLNIIDTAGIRNNQDIDTVEKIGIEKAKKEANDADLIILLLDISMPFDNDDQDLINLIKNLNKPTIILYNKIDLREPLISEHFKNSFLKMRTFRGSQGNTPRITELFEVPLNKDFKIEDLGLSSYTSILFSTKTREGYDKLLDTIFNMFINKNIDFNNEIFISNERQLQLIVGAKNALNHVIESIDLDMPEDLLTIDLTDAYTNLSKVLGIEVTDDIINEIFTKFCMGK